VVKDSEALMPSIWNVVLLHNKHEKQVLKPQ